MITEIFPKGESLLLCDLIMLGQRSLTHESLQTACVNCCRITLTYNLYSVPQAPAAHDSQTTNAAGSALSTRDVHVPLTTFSQELAAKLQDDNWYPSGTVLGFALDHLYAEVHEAPAEIQPYMLKGSDLLLYQTAVQLGLSIQILPAIDVRARDDSDDDSDLDDEDDKAVLVGDSFGEVLRPMGVKDRRQDLNFVAYNGSVSKEEFLKYVCGVSYDDSIVWVKRPREEHLKYRVKTAAYGNEPSMRSWYVAAVLLIFVPKIPRI